MKKFVWTGCLAYLVIAFAHVAVGSVLEDLLHHYGKNYSAGGTLIFLQFSGFLLGVLTSPWWSGRLGRRGCILLAFGALTAGELIFTFLPDWNLMLVAAPIAGYGFGMVESAIGAAVIEFAEEGSKASSMARLEVFFGVGAMLLPAIAGILIKLGYWRLSFPVIACLSLLCFILYARMSFGQSDGQFAKRPAEVKTSLRVMYQGPKLAVLAVLALFFALYVGIEMTFVNFLPSILIDKLGVQTSTGTAAVSLFWATMAFGRLFAGNLAERAGYGRYVTVSSFGALGLFLVFYSVSGFAASFAMVMGMGLLMAGIFAIALIFANTALPGTTETTTSLLIASGGVGGAVLPLVTGYTMDHYASDTAVALLAGLMAVMALLITGAARLNAARQRKQIN
ncbi:MFS transporter [Paenibacillus gansuensis]|uniref:MFS transporter n=1 Tax=Paenibacillus gansuensis TaxID=306542 RepID=A0ABW5PBD2_9BACL